MKAKNGKSKRKLSAAQMAQRKAAAISAARKSYIGTRTYRLPIADANRAAAKHGTLRAAVKFAGQ